MAKIVNPIITGFNPDPAVCRVGDDYYIATSTFEWFPGVQIHHSRDLVNWRLLCRPLDRVSQLDMRGISNSGGVWAPCLTYADGLFWLVYTNMKSDKGPWKDTPNYVVTAPNIEGPWSEPIFLNSSGFDPSMFHDDDGKKWVVNQLMDARPGKNRFAGIVIQEYDHKAQKLVGPVRNIWEGTERGITEGPHMYKRDGYYYLLTAEGGTAWRHAVSIARSKDLMGPYETHPDNPMLTSQDKNKLTLQHAGHGGFVEAGDGQWYVTHLCRRPLQDPDNIDADDFTVGKIGVLGRETSIQKMVWSDDGWPRLANGTDSPDVEVEGPDLPECKWPEEQMRDDFDGDELAMCFQTLREPVDESWCSLKKRKGWLTLKGRDSLYSLFDQSLIARRLKHFKAQAETCVAFRPNHYQQMAGLIAYYSKDNYHYLRITADDNGKPILSVIVSDKNVITEYDDAVADIASLDRVYMKMVMDHDDFRFYWSADGKDFKQTGPVLKSTNLGDGACVHSGFTGTFWGVCCQDMTGQFASAEFDYFDYRPME